jgi:hypothetical protein
MNSLAFLLTKKSISESNTSQIETDNLFKKLDLPDNDGHVYLYNKGIDVNDISFKEDEYLYVELDDSNVVTFSGSWLEGLKSEFCSINGSMTFILSEMQDEDHFYYLKDLYDGLLVKNNQEVVESFFSYGIDFVKDFIDNHDEENPENDEIDGFWNLLKKLEAESGDDYETIIQTLVISYTFHKLGVNVEADEDNMTLKCSLDGLVSIQTFLRCKEVLEDEMSELEEGDSYQFAYSIWTGSSNLDLFEELGLDNGEYISYPALKVGDYSAEPETGSWY